MSERTTDLKQADLIVTGGRVETRDPSRPVALADLALLDRDLFAPDAGPIGDARVLATLVEGVPVYEAADLGG